MTAYIPIGRFLPPGSIGTSILVQRDKINLRVSNILVFPGLLIYPEGGFLPSGFIGTSILVQRDKINLRVSNTLVFPGLLIYPEGGFFHQAL